jgi:DedD protein
MIEFSSSDRSSQWQTSCVIWPDSVIAMAETEQALSGTDDAETGLKKRARRRLVGATALALLAVVVLPLVMDKEPRPAADDIQIRIPSQDAGGFTSRIVQTKPAATPLPPIEAAPLVQSALPAAPAPAVAANPPGAPADAAAGKPAVAPVPAGADKPADKPAAKGTEEAARPPPQVADKSVRWVVQLGAYHDQANIKALRAKVKELGYASYTEDIETSHGTRTRVRAGPFASREAALKAQQRLKKIGAGGPAGGVVVQK